MHTVFFHSENAALYLPFGLQVNTDLDFDKTSGYSNGFNSTSWLWNAQISYSVLRDKSLTFSVRACDLLGQKKNISRSVSANGTITDSRYNDLTRYVMFGISYTFNTLKTRNVRKWITLTETRMTSSPASGKEGRGGMHRMEPPR